ncbi:MAG: ABC transporter permease [Planctomycetota bacterium]|jgi:ribose transport system permease protein|nr:ABC transporter permease [Planctomycetota bacterium]
MMNRDRSGGAAAGTFFRRYGILVIFCGLAVIISLVTPDFLTARNILNILRQSSIIGLMAIGTTFVIIGGGFDISVGPILALTAAVAIGMQSHLPWPAAVAAALLAGAAIGLANGVLAAVVGIVPIIATLGTMTIVRGLTYIYTGGYPLVGESQAFKYIGGGQPLGIPFPIILLAAMVLFWQFILARTRTGRYICAVGGNKEASRLSGVAVDYYHILTFVIGGFMAALAGVVYASRLNSATPLAGNGYEMDAIASTVIGGASVSGGEGSVFGTLVGVLLLNVVSNMFNLMGVPVYVQHLVKGVIILVVVGIDSYGRKAERR